MTHPGGPRHDFSNEYRAGDLCRAARIVWLRYLLAIQCNYRPALTEDIYDRQLVEHVKVCRACVVAPWFK